MTKRGGKYILTELLEATQSHQVSTKGKLDQAQPSIVTNANNVTDKGKKDLKKGKNNRINKGRSRKKEQLSEEIQMQGPMSLILLDEVRNYTIIFWFIHVVFAALTQPKCFYVINKPILGCIRMACDKPTTRLLQADRQN